MKRLKLSVLMPAIRPERWAGLYDSIGASLESFDDFELIFVSPFQLPKELESVPNVKLITDFGSPTRCFNIALELAEGEYVTWAADDGVYVEGKLKKVIDRLEAMPQEESMKTIIALSQIEAGNVYDREFCRINKHPPLQSAFIPDEYKLLPTGVMKRALMEALGGFDSVFQGHAMASIDFAIRAQDKGVKIEFEDDICLRLTHMMGPSGDHGPIHHSQIQEDEPLFRDLYQNPMSERVLKTATVSVDNWRSAEPVWHWRFGNVSK